MEKKLEKLAKETDIKKLTDEEKAELFVKSLKEALGEVLKAVGHLSQENDILDARLKRIEDIFARQKEIPSYLN